MQQPSQFPRLTAGARHHAHGRGRRPFFGEPVIWDSLFPQGRGRLRWLCLTLAAVVAVGVILGLTWGGVIPSLWGAGAPGGTPNGGTPPVETEISRGEETTHTPPEDTDGDEAHTREPDTEAMTGEDEILTSEVLTCEPDTAPPEGAPDGENPPESDTRPDEGETTSPAETAPPSDGETDATPPQEGDETETARPIPDGCYPIEGADKSQTELGAGYLVGETDNLPATLLPDRLWTGEDPPTVLVIHTHPYEGYGDGKAWYDPESGSLALTETANASDGVVALGAALARELRGRGATVIHLRIAVSASDTAAEIYDRTEAAIRTYCTLYPDIGLVLNLRRSAEMTENGGILKTQGTLDGETCAQLRISVSEGREEAALAGDLTLALALREGLWQTEPTLSRPVRVKAGSGIGGDLTRVRVLTLELGAAGNTYAEAERLVAPLAEALAGVLQ